MALCHQHPRNNILSKASWQQQGVLLIDMLPSGETMEPAGPNIALIVCPRLPLAIYIVEIP